MMRPKGIVTLWRHASHASAVALETSFLFALTDGFIADHYATRSHRLFNVPKAHCKPVVEQNGVRDDLSGEAMATVWVA